MILRKVCMRRGSIRKRRDRIGEFLLAGVDDGGVGCAGRGGRFPRAGGLRLDLGLVGGLTVANALSAPVSAVSAEDQEGGEDGVEQPYAG
ncbi:hypothetical protein, partial [Brevundimonas sp. P7753]|uniref:hypothetical protein n=1 Tax=Brevundimonas sp. P7753 TaxID=2726982 RepID=UPI001C4B4023